MKLESSRASLQRTARTRLITMLVFLGVGVVILVGRAIDLVVVDHDFLKDQGDARHLRNVSIPAHRGMILDRNGEPLAVSSPVASIWCNPQELLNAKAQWKPLLRLLGMNARTLEKHLRTRRTRDFVYIKRGLNPELAQQITALKLPGVALTREYRRFYPGGEVTAHVLGFTNVDDIGQEGLELAFDHQLRGVNGIRRVVRDSLGRIVEHVAAVREPSPGKDVVLSIDRRIQYLAYRELKAAIQANQAQSGSVVVLDARSGEVLAMVNQPSFNSNARGRVRVDHYRNRAVTDLFEPGSTLKPFTVAAALEAGTITSHTKIETGPGTLRVGGHTVRDMHNYGLIDATTVIQKSSNVGVAKLALDLSSQQLWSMFARIGLGASTQSGLPGEMNGVLRDYRRWRDIDRVTASFGYGLSVTPMQLAQAYSVLADQGRLKPVTLRKMFGTVPSVQVLQPEVAMQVRTMLASVAAEGGTGLLARVAGYRVGGKTGTVYKTSGTGYATDRYVGVFAGMAPLSQPRLVMVAMINDPAGDDHTGGQIAAPVFGRVMAGALRLLDIPPDDIETLRLDLEKNSWGPHTL